MKDTSNLRVPAHLYVFLVLGVFGGLALFIVPVLIVNQFVHEQARYEACRTATRTDCQPSIFWYVNGWVSQENAREPAPSTATSTETGVTSTQESVTSTVSQVPTSTKATTKRTRKR